MWGRSEPFRRLARVIRAAQFCERHNLPTRQGLDRLAGIREAGPSRREFLARAGLLAVGAAASPSHAAAKGVRGRPRIAIVGGGLAGLASADRLQSKGYLATIYEAGPRLGGRCTSIRHVFPGQVAEGGGEYIDTSFKTMLSYANEFNLAREDVTTKAGEVAYHFFGRHHDEVAVVDQFRRAVAAMKGDVRRLSNAPTFFEHNEADVALDNVDLATYLDARTPGLPLIRAVLDVAYVAEYGTETFLQSPLNFLMFIRLNRRSTFEPFGPSDERFHLVGGNDGIVAGLQAKLRGPIATGMRLRSLRRNGFGEFVLGFEGFGRGVIADAVVLTIPFSVLRGVDLHPSLGLVPDQLRAIAALGYGTSAKTMIGFDGRIWSDRYGSSGIVFTDLDGVQNTWETNRANAGPTAMLTDYAGGERGRTLDQGPVQTQVDRFLNGMELVYPGIKATASRRVVDGSYVAHREHWASNPHALGSYTCYFPGQFTTIAGLEGVAAGPLKFAGEHTDSFYSYQGFLEGGCLSGIRAANEILADIKAGRL